MVYIISCKYSLMLDSLIYKLTLFQLKHSNSARKVDFPDI